ncbi:MAG: DUF4166 domain-containing protein [Gammaproteobacteria bacterium]|nr:DUF4166 domain-containing protein [Gammaproteobacteria bacterium]
MTGQALVATTDLTTGDRSFADLLTPAQWYRLPAPIRRRFSAPFCTGRTVCYRGRVIETRLTRVGWLLAQLTRLVGAPLPLHRESPRGEAGIATVVVTDHPGNGGQIWSRHYHRRRGFPQAIHSVKRFAGPTGLEEYLGFGLSMALELRARGSSLAFIGSRYFLSFGFLGLEGWRFELPGWMSPGVLTVEHREEGEGWFSFSLSLDHPRLGCLVYQLARFRDDADPG